MSVEGEHLNINDGDIGPINVQGLSKNAQKKAARLKRLKEAKRLKKERKKNNKIPRKIPSLKPTCDEHLSKKSLRERQTEGLRQGLISGQRIAIDLSYNSLMTEKELIHLASQLRRVYGINRVSEGIAHLYFVNMSEDSDSFRICKAKNEGFEKYLVDRTEKDVLELFKPEDVVYLSPDASEPLHEVEKSKVYVIGGLSDDSVKKNSSLQLALGKGLMCKRLPIEEFCDRLPRGTFSKILTINTVFELLVSFVKCGSWPEAFQKCLPNRNDQKTTMNSPKIVSFPQWYTRMTNTFRSFFHARRFIDLLFICKDGRRVLTHRMVIALSSPFLRMILANHIPDDDETTVSVSLPDFDAGVVTAFAEALYTGTLPLNDTDLVSHIRDLCDIFKLPFMVEDPPTLPEPEVFEDELSAVTLQTENTQSISKKADLQMIFVRSDDIESDMHDLNFGLNQELKDSQDMKCPHCCRRAIQHRVIVEDECADENDENMSNIFVYRCCLQECIKKIFKNAKAFNRHMRKHDPTHDSSLNQSRNCPLCIKPRISHKNKDIAGDKKNGNFYRCCICSAAKLTSRKFFDHVENHVSKKMKCDQCHKGYSRKDLLEAHVANAHRPGSGNNESFSCQDCPFVAKHRQTLLSHIQEKHQGIKRQHRRVDQPVKGESAPTVKCPNCGKELKKWYYVQYHRKTCATGSNFFHCHICLQEGFVNSTTLNNHIRSKHTLDRPFSCEHCPAKYATSMALSSHRARKHNTNKAGEFVPKKLYPCQICGKILSSRTKLSQHIKVIHENQRNFQCNFCDKRFTSKSNMKIHEGNIHTRDLPYKCNICGLSFSRKSALSQHRNECKEEPCSTTNGNKLIEHVDALASAVNEIRADVGPPDLEDFGLGTEVTGGTDSSFLVVGENVMGLIT